jgi:hypothetical protein
MTGLITKSSTPTTPGKHVFTSHSVGATKVLLAEISFSINVRNEQATVNWNLE